jgi:anti-anti-sigma factor
MGTGRRPTELTLRAYRWGALVVVVARGAIDATNFHRFDSYLSEKQGTHDLILDLVDLTTLDRSGVRIVTQAAKRAERTGWGFAVVAEPHSSAAEAIRGYRLGSRVRMLPSRQAARDALQLMR